MAHEERMEKRMLRDKEGNILKNEDGVEQFNIHLIDIEDKGAISVEDCDDEIKQFRGRIRDAEARKVKIQEAKEADAVS